jgi:hypothetical protein
MKINFTPPPPISLVIVSVVPSVLISQVVSYLEVYLTKFHSHFSVLPHGLYITHISSIIIELQTKYKYIKINVLLLITAEDCGLFILQGTWKRKTVGSCTSDVIKTRK